MKSVEESQFPAKFKFSQGEIEISGTEEFVSKYVEEFKGLLQSMFNSYIKKLDPPGSSASPPDNKYTHNSGKEVLSNKVLPSNDYAEFIEVDTKRSLNDYENVFAIDGDRIQIICDVPGASLAKRMINLILIYLWIKSKLNIDEVSFTELRDVCEMYGALDRPNFAKHMHLNKKYFILNGTGKNLMAKLIRPGFKEAEHLIHELNIQ